MIYFFAVSYLTAIVLQPAEWVSIFEGIPIQEIILLLGWIAAFLGNMGRLFSVVWSVPGRYFLGYIIISIASCYGEGREYYLGVVGLGLVKFYMGFVLLVVGLDTTIKLRKAIYFMVIPGLLVAYLCIRLSQTGIGVGAGIGIDIQELNWRGAVMWIGSFGGSNTTGSLLLVLTSLAFGLSYKEKVFMKKLWINAASLLIGYSFLLTNSRGGFFGLLAMLGYSFYERTKLNLKVFVPIILAFFVLVLVLKPQEKGRGIGESTTSERIELFHHGLQMVKNNPIFGVGYGQFPRNNPIRKTAHNIYLNTIAETGLVGFMTFFIMYYCTIKELFKLKGRMSKDDILHRTSISVIYAVVGFSVSTFFLSSHHELPYVLLAFLMIPTFNQGCSYEITTKEYKYIFLLTFSVLAFIYALVQLFYVIFR